MSSAVIRMPVSRRHLDDDQFKGGIDLCCCRICTCVNFSFFTSKYGLLKLCEVILASFCQTLLVRFGLPAAGDIGPAFNSFLTTASACLMTSSILLFCFIMSKKTFMLMQQTMFEFIYNFVACFLYLSAASYMGFIVNVWLYPQFAMRSAYIAYPAMTAVYYIGFIVGIVHGADGYMGYKTYRQYA